MDIVERLRAATYHELDAEAADEIERLRAELKRHDAWLSQAHALCSDLGCRHGHIEDRLFEALESCQKRPTWKFRGAEPAFRRSVPCNDGLGVTDKEKMNASSNLGGDGWSSGEPSSDSLGRGTQGAR